LEPASQQLSEVGQPVADGLWVDVEPRSHRVPARISTGPAGSRRAAPPQPAHDPDGADDFVGIVMAKSAEGDAAARLLARRDEAEVIEQPSF
jgi:hypothetical protein